MDCWLPPFPRATLLVAKTSAVNRRMGLLHEHRSVWRTSLAAVPGHFPGAGRYMLVDASRGQAEKVVNNACRLPSLLLRVLPNGMAYVCWQHKTDCAARNMGGAVVVRHHYRPPADALLVTISALCAFAGLNPMSGEFVDGRWAWYITKPGRATTRFWT